MMKFLRFVCRGIKAALRWWDTNASKRWLLALDRFCICWMFGFILTGLREIKGITGGECSDVDFLVVAALLMFLVLYVPSYMFPAANSPVRDSMDPDDAVDDSEHEKEP